MAASCVCCDVPPFPLSIAMETFLPSPSSAPTFTFTPFQEGWTTSSEEAFAWAIQLLHFHHVSCRVNQTGQIPLFSAADQEIYGGSFECCKIFATTLHLIRQTEAARQTVVERSVVWSGVALDFNFTLAPLLACAEICKWYFIYWKYYIYILYLLHAASLVTCAIFPGNFTCAARRDHPSNESPVMNRLPALWLHFPFIRLAIMFLRSFLLCNWSFVTCSTRGYVQRKELIDFYH